MKQLGVSKDENKIREKMVDAFGFNPLIVSQVFSNK